MQQITTVGPCPWGFILTRTDVGTGVDCLPHLSLEG